MKIDDFSETGIYHTTWGDIPENINIHSQTCQNLKPQIYECVFF
jgi:hypothetical protein